MSETKTRQAAPAAPKLATNGAAGWLDEYNDLLPNLDELVTDDGMPRDNLYVERLYKLLTDTLYASWVPPGDPGRLFLAASDVGWFQTAKDPPVAPDVMVSLDVEPLDPGTREGRSYFQWIRGKTPDLVIEIVSDGRADEPGERLRQYQRWRLPYYVIHDPFGVYDGGVLRAFELRGGKFVAIDHRWIEELGLGLTMWDGEFQGITHSWLRWCDRDGQVLPTGEERARKAESQVEQAEEKAEQAEEKAEQAADLIRRLQAQLRGAGIEPES